MLHVKRPCFVSGKISLAGLLLAAAATSARADPVVHIERASTWKLFRGLSEASSPDPTAWRRLGFADASWAEAVAPIGYGEPGLGTDLSALSPPMQNNYSSIFLRRVFTIASPSATGALELRVNYDDGLVAWINGVEVMRANMRSSSGDPVAYNDFAFQNHEQGSFETFELADPRGYLEPGENVIAVQVFNNQIASSDLYFDLELVDPFGADSTAPVVTALVPAAGTTVRSLTRIEVTFSEAVVGVGPDDLRVNGVPATSLSGAGAGPFIFTFVQPPAGTVQLAWAPGHGITDLADPPNPFAGGTWTYTLDPSVPASGLVINEILASNRDGLKDEDGEASDWIEIYNPGSAAVSLEGWSLTDDGDPGKWVFPAVSLAPNAYLVVFASGKDRRTPGARLHTSFKLDAGGEYLGLFSPEAPRRVVFEFSPRFPPQRTDISYGLDAAGAPVYFSTPTPGAPNGTSGVLSGFVAELRSSVPRGFYSEPFFVELSTPTPGAAIYYRLDGREPSQSAGTLYTGPIRVAASARQAAVLIRAIAYKSGALPSSTATFTYIFPAHVATQPDDPAGFPATWGAAPAVDYGIDPEIVNDPRYSGDFAEGLLALPSLSIVCDVAHMFGPSGIYSNPTREGVAWERPASVELLRPDGRQQFQVNCGIRIQGGASREPLKSPKHSLRLLFKGDYGPTRLREPLIPGIDHADGFDTVTLRADFNNSWVHWDGAQRSRATKIRDQWARDTQIEMGQLSSHGTYVHLYVNGLYWGVYNAVERPSAAFAASHLGGEKEEYDSLNSGAIVDGDRNAWNAMMSLATAGLATSLQYAAIQQYLDVSGLIDYMTINLYGANADWPHHNWYAVRRRRSDAQYKFVCWDTERILEGVNANNTGVSNNDTPAFLYSRLRANPEFRLHFADRLQRHLFNGGALTPERAAARFLARAAQIEKAIVCESARWGDYRRDVHPYSNGPYELYTRDVHWRNEQNRLLTQYFPQRTGVLLGQFRAIGLYPAVGAPLFNQHGGPIPPGFTLTMSHPAGTTGTIHYTMDGSDPRLPDSGALAPGALTYSGPLLLEDTTRILARTLSGGTWSALCEALFSVSTPAESLRVSEIMYHPLGGEQFEFIELVNQGAYTIDLSGLAFTSGISFAFAEGSSLAPGEHLVLASNPAAFLSRYPGVAVAGAYGGQLSNGGEKVTLKDASGATVFSVDYDDEGFWPIAPDGFGWSLVALDPGGDLDSPLNWRASAQIGGSPGRADPLPVHGAVVINEVLASGSPPLENAIELFNTGDRSVDIGGWFLSDSRESEAALRKFRIPPGTSLPPGGYSVLYASQFGPQGGAYPGFELDPRGGAVYLASAVANGSLSGHITGHEISAAEGQLSFGRYATSTGLDFTALSATSFGADSAATVEEFRSGRGAPNALPWVGPVVISEIHYHPLPGDEEFLELHNRTGAPIALHDAALGGGWRVSGIRNLAGTGDYEFPPGAMIPAGGFLLIVQIDPAQFRSRYAIPANVPIHGPYGGALDNSGERLKLLRPAAAGALILAEQVRYNDKLPWPVEADGEGPSLERVRSSDYANDPLNWASSRQVGGTPGAPNSAGQPGVNQRPLASFTVHPQPQPLSVRFDASASYDPDGSIVAYSWQFGDGTTGSGESVLHVFPSAGTYTVRLTVRDGEGAQATATRLVTLSGPDAGGYQLPGDSNQDGSLDISDAVSLLARLFLGGARPLPCDGPLSSGGNRRLLDVNGDEGVDLTDAVYLLNFLFRSGPAPALGLSCVRIQGCPDACVPQ
jgi:hypothetical protein